MNLEDTQRAIKHLKSLRTTVMWLVVLYIVINMLLVFLTDYRFDLSNIILLVGTFVFLVALILIHKLINRYERKEKEFIDRSKNG